jgi:hypothetical protein
VSDPPQQIPELSNPQAPDAETDPEATNRLGSIAGDAPASAATLDPAQQPEEPRIHVYGAAASQRERVLSSFHEQRDAIFKAVAEQRAATAAPIEAVRAQLSGLGRSPAGRDAPLGASPAPAVAARQRGAAATPEPRRAVAAEIVASLKQLIAEEVQRQLQLAFAALECAPGTSTPRNTSDPTPPFPPPH